MIVSENCSWLKEVTDLSWKKNVYIIQFHIIPYKFDNAEYNEANLNISYELPLELNFLNGKETLWKPCRSGGLAEFGINIKHLWRQEIFMFAKDIVQLKLLSN